jgi:hypothetical protein
MTYQVGGSIQAADYNALVGTNNTTDANKLNTVLGTGASSAGYGQTQEAVVAAGDSVTAVKWANLVTKTANIALHQGSTITTVTAPVAGGSVAYLSAVPTNLTTIYTNRLNALAQGTSVPYTATKSVNWANTVSFTFTVTFSSSNQARYFFNAGGQLKLTAAHPGVSTPQDIIAKDLTTNMGTLVLSSGTATIATIPYTGFNKVGGSGSSEILLTTRGFYNLDGTATVAYRQRVSGGSYNNSLIEVLTSLVGSVITITCTINIDPDSVTMTQPTSSTLTVYPPSTTYIADSWGTITVSSSVS